ncbi:MAG: AraC family transcriptional regulator [Lachnospiraceae bacterium]|nr:AraC family transcriptional regulator [Lachnospiraceae bacterium]
MIDTFLSKECCFLKVRFAKKHYTDNRRGSPYHYVARLMKGSARLRSQGEIIYLNAGDVFYIPKNIPYESFWSGSEIEWYSFGFSYFPEADKTDFKIQKILCDESLKDELSSISMPPNITSKALADFYGILARLIPFMTGDEGYSDERIFQKSKLLMENHIEWSISEIAQECHISYSTLYLIYRKVCGKTPNTIRQEILVQRAVLLLSTTDQSVQEISDKLGFSSTSYFRKILKKYTSLTPTQIKQMSSAKI